MTSLKLWSSNRFISRCYRSEGILVINSMTASGGERFCLTSKLTALQTKAPSRLREQRQSEAMLDTRLPVPFLFSIHLTSPHSWWHCDEWLCAAMKLTSQPTFKYSKELALLIPWCGDIIKARIKKIASQPVSLHTCMHHQPCLADLLLQWTSVVEQMCRTRLSWYSLYTAMCHAILWPQWSKNNCNLLSQRISAPMVHHSNTTTPYCNMNILMYVTVTNLHVCKGSPLSMIKPRALFRLKL